MKPRLHRLVMQCAAGWGLALVAPAVHAQACGTTAVEWIVGGPAGNRSPFIAGSTGITGSSGCATAAPATSAAPAAHAGRSAPAATRVPAALQRVRDDERLSILQLELARELAYQSGTGPTAPDAAALVRSQANVAALRAEMARVGTLQTVQTALKPPEQAVPGATKPALRESR